MILNDQGSKIRGKFGQVDGGANDKIRTKLRGDWPKPYWLGVFDHRRFAILLFLPSIHIARDIYESFVLAKYFKGDDQRLSIFSSFSRPWNVHDENEESLYFFFFFFLFPQGETSLFFRRRDFSRSTVAQFSKIRRDSLLPGIRTILRYRVITQLEVRPLVRKRGVLFLSLMDLWWA